MNARACYVREAQTTYKTRRDLPQVERVQVSSPAQAAALLVPMLEGEPVENFISLRLDTKHRITGKFTRVSVGSLDACIVHPREVFTDAVRERAAAVIVAHNHPSGDPAPSADDVSITARLKAAGELLGVAVLDHVIIGHDGRYYSFREAGTL